jgi:capsular polysaccharide transport system permease protein
MTGRPVPVLQTPIFPAPADDGASLPPPRFSAPRTIVALMLREVGSSYGRSPGGYAWVVLQSLGIIMMMSLVFSFVVRSPALGNSFLLFYATGWLSYGFYRDIEGKTKRSLRQMGGLLAYPRVVWLDVVLARVCLATVTEAFTIIAVMALILSFSDAHASISIPPLLTAMAIAGLLGIGVGLLDCILSGLYQLWAVFWGIVTRPLMIASCVLYIYEDLPRFARDIIWYNPLVHVTGLFRTGFYETYDAAYVSLPYVFGVALTLVMLGLVFMRAWYKLVLEG